MRLTGAANFRPDDSPYTDGEIVREGPVGDQGDGPYSAGRGGAGNIDKDGTPDRQVVGDETVVPEAATREHREDNYHFGRGGAGNEWHEKPQKPKKKTVSQAGFEKEVPEESLKDKIKDVFHKN